MTEHTADFESLLRQALAPVEPPPQLEERVELMLGTLVELAADELESWELRAMRDPRNWLRPAAAVVIGSGAAVGLVVVRTQRRRHRRLRDSASPVEFAQRTMRDALHEAGRIAEDVRPWRR